MLLEVIETNINGEEDVPASKTLRQNAWLRLALRMSAAVRRNWSLE